MLLPLPIRHPPHPPNKELQHAPDNPEFSFDWSLFGRGGCTGGVVLGSRIIVPMRLPQPPLSSSGEHNCPNLQKESINAIVLHIVEFQAVLLQKALESLKWA